MDDFDAREFDDFYVRSRDRLAMQIAALTGDPVEAVDHVQEAYIRAWARWTYVGGLEDPEGWVRRVARNLAVSRWRRARRLVLRAGPAERSIDWDDDQRSVVDALRTLPRSHREAIVLHHLVGLSVDEIAADMNAPVGTVKSWLSRGRRQLTTALTGAPATEGVSS